MRLNIQKSSVMWFSPKRASVAVCPTVLIDGNLLQEVETQRYLGIIFDNKLQWKAQVNRVCRKISYA